jgi:hypothetical protein
VAADLRNAVRFFAGFLGVFAGVGLIVVGLGSTIVGADKDLVVGMSLGGVVVLLLGVWLLRGVEVPSGGRTNKRA